jgi:hypothetical protein
MERSATENETMKRTLKYSGSTDWFEVYRIENFLNRVVLDLRGGYIMGGFYKRYDGEEQYKLRIMFEKKDFE